MVSEKKRPRKYRRLLVWVALILFVVLCASAISNAQIRRGGNSIAGIATSTVTKVATKSSITPTVASTPTVVQTPVPLFAEDFNNNHNGWAVNTAEYVRTLSNGKLTLSVTNHTILTESVPIATPLSNFTLSTDFTLQKAGPHDRMGLYLRGDGNLDYDYRIDVYGNNTITINKESLDATGVSQSAVLATISSKDSILNPVGQQNYLMVEMNGPDITLWINGVEVKTLQDYDYTHGQADLFVENVEPSKVATVTFSSLDITSIPNPLPDVAPSPTPTTTPSATKTPSSATATPSSTSTTGPSRGIQEIGCTC
jgi:hypothetical protein